MLGVQLYAYRELARYNGFEIQELCYALKKRGVMKLIEPDENTVVELAI